MTLLISCIVAWLVCATIGASTYLAHFQRDYPSLAVKSYKDDSRRAWLSSLMFGTGAVIASLICSEGFKYGFMNPFVLNKYKE